MALKVMSVKDGKAIVPIKGVRREIQYASSVQHENIVKLIDFVADEKQIVIVWELINGSDLLDLLNDKGGRLDEVQASGYFRQLLQGVTFIHAHGLCHRDLKPENCMIEKASDRLKIIDFGLSKHQQSAVTLGVGTPDYMAPELLGGTGGSSFAALQERRVGHYDARACDVWAMGVLLYLLVTGQYPFEDPRQPQNVVATLQNIAAGRMRPLPSHISKDCKQLIASMLNQNPMKRITLQEISEHPWLKKASTEISGFEQLMEVDVTINTESSHRFPSFSFPDQNNVPAKATPVTPKMVALNASPAKQVAQQQQQGLAPPSVPSPTLSAPNAQGVLRSARGDLIVPVTPPQGGSDHGKRSRIGGFCRMWFGTPKNLVMDC